LIQGWETTNLHRLSFQTVYTDFAMGTWNNIYDAEGASIGKGTLASAPSSYTATCAPPLASGFTLTARYLVDLGGDQVTELSEQGLPTPQTEQWQHSNVWAAGKLTAS
jgi:hypothetical protein